MPACEAPNGKSKSKFVVVFVCFSDEFLFMLEMFHRLNDVSTLCIYICVRR